MLKHPSGPTEIRPELAVWEATTGLRVRIPKQRRSIIQAQVIEQAFRNAATGEIRWQALPIVKD